MGAYYGAGAEDQRATLSFALEGRIDATTAPAVEQAIWDELASSGQASLCLDTEGLSYISSAGLRMVMRLLKACESVSVVNASPEVYAVFEMTGLTDLMDVRRRLREVDVAGLEQIGAGAFGKVYRLDGERVIKVYGAGDLDRIERERQAARQAFVHGVPSAIPFDTVRVGTGYGSIYELIDARTLGQVVAGAPELVDDYAQRMAALLSRLHETRFAEGELPDARGILHGWVSVAEASGLYAQATIARLRDFVEAIPASDGFVHGDYHPANIMVMPDGELLLIDMGDASAGHPGIDLAGCYHVLRVAARRPGGAQRLTGMPLELVDRLWERFLRAYFDTTDERRLARIEDMLAICALPRGMGSVARSRLITDEVRRRQAAELEQRFLARAPEVRWDVLRP